MNYKKIKKNTDYQKLFKKGKRSFSNSLTVLYAQSKELAMGISLGKKHGKSVTRNRIKRLLRVAFSNEEDKIKDVDVILIPKVAENYSLEIFSRDLKYILKKEKLYKS